MNVSTKIGISVLMILFLTVGLCFGQNTVDQIFTKGVEYGAEGKFQEAKEQFEKALEVDPFYEPAKEVLQVIEDVIDQKIKSKTAIHLFRGAAHANKGQWDEAFAEYNKVTEINSRFAMAYKYRGVAYVKGKGEYDQAISDFSKAIEINPRFAEAYSNRGYTYQARGKYDQAISDFNKAIELNPKLAIAYYNRGVAYVQGKGEYDRAISDCNKAIELNPNYAEAYHNRGGAYGNKGEYDQAISDYNKAIELNPKLAEAYNNRGVAYYFKKEYDKAWEDVYKAQSLGVQVHPGFLKALREASGRQK